MSTPKGPAFFGDPIIKRDDPNAWKSYVGRPNTSLRNPNLQPISEHPNEDESISSTVDNNNKRSDGIIDSQLLEHAISINHHKPEEGNNRRSNL